jgi:hypothetical protein
MERCEVDTVIDFDQVAADQIAADQLQRQLGCRGPNVGGVRVHDHRTLAAWVVAQAVRKPELEDPGRSRRVSRRDGERIPWTEAHTAS